MIRTLKFFHWVWTVVTAVIAGFWFIYHGGANWVPVSIPMVSKAIAETVEKKGDEVLTSSSVAVNMHADAVNIAAQLGRMDMAALAMTIISVVFAILGIFGFMHLKDRAEYIAKTTTEDCFNKFKEELTGRLETQATQYMELAVPDMFADYREMYINSMQSESDADDIAPQDDEGLNGE